MAVMATYGNLANDSILAMHSMATIGPRLEIAGQFPILT